MFAHYDATNLLEAIEFAAPSDPTLGGVSLATATMRDAIDHLCSLDPQTQPEGGGAISTALGVGVWRSTGELDQPVMSVITFGPGYYD